MAYKIEFTASVYVNRARRKTALRFLLLAAVAAAAWQVKNIHVTYKEPTLNMKLAEYEVIARPIEEMNAAWDTAAKEYDSVMKYYRLVWAGNPTNFLAAVATNGIKRISRGSRPLRWTLATGGECVLEHVYTFGTGDKSMQVRGFEDDIANAVTSMVDVVGGKVDVTGVPHENLLDVTDFNVKTRFLLADIKPFPAKESSLVSCVHEIVAMRDKVQDAKITQESGERNVPATAKGMMIGYLQLGKDKSGFPEFANVIDVAGWFGRADKFIAAERIPDDPVRARMKEVWNKVGDARFPWDRFRHLDNDILVSRTKALAEVSDGVRQFKGFLEQRHEDFLKKISPFTNAYEHDDVFNKPLISTDLKDRVCGGIALDGVSVSFEDDTSDNHPVLEKEDEKFTFSWVRWEMAIGGEAEEKPLSLEKLSECALRVLTLGPGYALGSVTIDFSADGNVSGAVLKGLLPVRKTQSVKNKNVAGGEKAGEVKN